MVACDKGIEANHKLDEKSMVSIQALDSTKYVDAKVAIIDDRVMYVKTPTSKYKFYTDSPIAENLGGAFILIVVGILIGLKLAE